MMFGGGGGRMRAAGLRRPLRMSSLMASAVSSAHWTFVAMTPEAPSLRPAADVETTGGGGGGIFVVPNAA